VKRRTLGRWSRRILRALAEVVKPIGPGIPEVSTDELVDFADDLVRYMPRLLRLAFPIGLLLLELGAFVLGPSLVPFSAMRPARRLRYLQSWIDARWRLRRDLIKAVKGVVLLKFYSDRRVAAELGYRPDEHVALVQAERLHRHAHQL
jgi:hypothetical protein